MTFALALHGGAGASRKLDYRAIRTHMRGLVEAARDQLARSGAALDVAIEVVAEMEASGLYVAGKGGSPNLIGEYELDAAVMDGASRRAGAVACMRGFKHPVRIARLVMEKTPHILLCADGAEAFARARGAEEIPAGDGWFTRAGEGESNFAPPMRSTGTVGCVVLDEAGRLASATSTAGVFDKTPGRIGDTPLAGAGYWADGNVAVSCTGQGELFILTNAAAKLAFLVENGAPLSDAAQRVIAEIASLGGEGGLVAIDRAGKLSLPYNAEGMKRATLSADGEIRASVFDD
jgi:L-asparaginase/beta-aspartyl-peptidase (threonine type)